MATSMSGMVALKRFLERDDEISPGGGRKVPVAELKALTEADKLELGPLACAELGVEWQPPKTKAA